MTKDISKSKAVLSVALNISVDKVDSSMSLNNTPEWDSLAHMRLILEIEKEKGSKLTPDQVISIVDLESVEATLSKV
ncbi:MAG: acyl carrier protein [Pseudomonadota bacterium]